VFNALARLSENASTFETHESPLELEQRANSILETVSSPKIDADKDDDTDARAMELARLQILDFDMSDLTEVTGEPAAPPPPLKAGPPVKDAPPPSPDPAAKPAAKVAPKPAPAKPNTESPDAGESGENSMEFTLPPGELDRIFVESKSGVPPPFPLGSTQAAPPPVSPSIPAPVPAAAPPPVPKPAAKSPRQPVAANPYAAPKRVAKAPAAEEEDGGPLPDIEVVKDNRSPASTLSGGFMTDAVRRQMLETIDPVEFDFSSQRPPLTGGSFALWLTLAILAGLLLAGQLVHRNREWLAAHGPLAPLIRSVYSTMGAPVAAPANLAAYQLRQWGVTGDPSAGSTLKMRASIMNTSSQLVAFPLLRLTLANRYGASLGRRDFEPSEYLGKPTARLLAPGERVDATLSIIDPGKDAEGFEIDVCLKGSDQRIVCANDVAPPQPKS
jgi:hypothetical protein